MLWNPRDPKRKFSVRKLVLFVRVTYIDKSSLRSLFGPVDQVLPQEGPIIVKR